MKINFNIHSNYSLNSNVSINDICNTFKDFDIISVTDHNSVKSCYDLKSNSKVKYINGLEADATVDGMTFDYLCYGFNLANVDDWVNKTFLTIGERQQKIFDKLISLCKSKNIELDNSVKYDLNKQYAHNVIFNMLTQEFKEKNEITNLDEFYRKSTTNKEFELYIDMSSILTTAKKLTDFIHRNKGLVFLAHPRRYNLDYKEVLELNKNIVDGIEISNNPKTEDEVEELYDYAIRNNLKITYGTNYNGIKHLKLEPKFIKKEYEKCVLDWVNSYIN